MLDTPLFLYQISAALMSVKDSSVVQATNHIMKSLCVTSTLVEVDVFRTHAVLLWYSDRRGRSTCVICMGQILMFCNWNMMKHPWVIIKNVLSVSLRRFLILLFTDICYLDLGMDFFGGAGNQPYSVEPAKSLFTCKARCLQDPRCAYVGFRPEDDVHMCYLYGSDFDLLALEHDETSLVNRKKCPAGKFVF